MRIRVLQPVRANLDLQPGDELLVQHSSPQIEALLSIVRLDHTKALEVVPDEGDEVAVAPPRAPERAVMGSRRGQRAAAVP